MDRRVRRVRGEMSSAIEIGRGRGRGAGGASQATSSPAPGPTPPRALRSNTPRLECAKQVRVCCAWTPRPHLSSSTFLSRSLGARAALRWLVCMPREHDDFLHLRALRAVPHHHTRATRTSTLHTGPLGTLPAARRGRAQRQTLFCKRLEVCSHLFVIKIRKFV